MDWDFKHLNLHPLTAQWFTKAFEGPTEVQRQGWSAIKSGQDTLIAAPTGSGKTLTAFLVALDHLIQEAMKYDGILEGLPNETQVLYVSPLKSLSNDIKKNLERPLLEIQAEATLMGLSPPQIRIMVRTGDTPQSQRQSMIRKPPHILVTTPESLYLLLTTIKGRGLLATVKTVIIDEIHALISDKRGSHLSLSLARLDRVCRQKPQRIGLSATQKPLEKVAEYLTGKSQDHGCLVVNTGHRRHLDLGLEGPRSALSAICSHEQWSEVYLRLVELINQHQSTLIFVNTRKLAERVCFHLSQILGDDLVQSHHGSLAKDMRLKTEERLKAGQLKAIVATASLELGIDVGSVDLVCQIGSPRAFATFLQRVGRAGHSVLGTPKGRLFVLTRDELLESTALLWGVKEGELDALVIPEKPLDILAQQVIAEAACQETHVDDLWKMILSSYSFRNLERKAFDELIQTLASGFAPGRERRSYVTLDRLTGMVRGRKGALLAAVTSGGAIPELGDFRVVVADEGTVIGSVNEDFALESSRGDIFLLGNTSWQVVQLKGTDLLVRDAGGAPPSIPFWFGEAPGRSKELSAYVSKLRQTLSDKITLPQNEDSPLWALEHVDQLLPLDPEPYQTARRWLESEVLLDPWLSLQLVHYLAVQKAAMGIIPTQEQVVFERFFDDTGGMQLVIHAPFGMRINKGFGLALRKRFCRSFDFELQASADNDGVVLSLSEQQSFPTEQLFTMLNPANVTALLEQAVLQAPLFNIRWRWNTNRSLAVLRFQGGKRIPPVLQRFRSDDLMTAVFPAQTQCQENVVGDIPIPDHPIVRQTMNDCLHEAIDLDGLKELLHLVQNKKIKFIPFESREPSPFAYQLLNSMPYAFLDDAPLEERRTRALTLRHTLPMGDLKDLAKLAPEAVALVRHQVGLSGMSMETERDLTDALTLLGAVEPEELTAAHPAAKDLMKNLQSKGRALELLYTKASPPLRLWVGLDQLDLVLAAAGDAEPLRSPNLKLAPELVRPIAMEVAAEYLIKAYLDCHPVVRGMDVAKALGIAPAMTQAILAKLESDGALVRGFFTEDAQESSGADQKQTEQLSLLNCQWCERRLLARIHRLTIEGLRSQIKPVSVAEFYHFLADYHHCSPKTALAGRDGLVTTLEQLQGYEAPAGTWEPEILGLRVRDYKNRWIDELTLSGLWIWGRLRPPPADAAPDASDRPATPLEEDHRTPSSSGGMTRIVPISFCQRADLPWLLPRVPSRPVAESPNDAPSHLGAARAPEPKDMSILLLLKQFGALFFTDLLTHTRLLESQLQDQLSELARQGLIHADGFGAIRPLIHKASQKASQGSARHASPLGSLKGRLRGRYTSRNSFHAGHQENPGGRWALFPPATGLARVSSPVTHLFPEPEPDLIDDVMNWARLLLRRYGVMFKALLTKEQAAPSWGSLLRAFRTLEARGEVRGGQFVAGPWGEQFAEESMIATLRSYRGRKGLWAIVHAADPLNLVGVLLPGERIPGSHKTTLAVVDGELVAMRQGSDVTFVKDLAAPLAAEIRQGLLLMGSFRSQLWAKD